MDSEPTAARAAPLLLSAAREMREDDAAPAVIIGQGHPKTRNGLPCHYFWRQAIADGQYTDDERDITCAVTPLRRKTWEANYRKLREQGEEPPVVMDHADTKSTATLGYVVDVRQNGKWLEELHQYLGDDSRDIALKNKISVGIHPKYKTGNGVFLGDCIIHSATTPRPVVPGQGDAVPFAASRGPARDSILLSLAASTQETPMDLTALRKAVGAADTVPDADVLSQAVAKLGSIPTLETERNDARTELSRRPAAKVPDPDILAEAAALKLEKVEHLAATGVISAQGAEFLRKRVNGADGKPVALMLSRSPGAEESPIDALLAFASVARAGIVPAGEAQTGVQELSRQVHDHSGVTGGTGQAKQQTPEEKQAAIDTELSRTELGRRALHERKKAS